MSEHTPGPWLLNEQKTSVWKGEHIVAAITIGRAVSIADARLISAAPELLEALQALIAEYEPNLKAFATDAPRKAKWEVARAAIAKATGEAA